MLLSPKNRIAYEARMIKVPASIELPATFIATKSGEMRIAITNVTCSISVVAWPKRIAISDRSFMIRFMVIPLSVIGVGFLRPELC